MIKLCFYDLSEDLTATIRQKNCTNVDFTNFQLPLDHFILGTNRKWPPFFDWKCRGWKLHLLREIFYYSIVTVGFSFSLILLLTPLTFEFPNLTKLIKLSTPFCPVSSPSNFNHVLDGFW